VTLEAVKARIAAACDRVGRDPSGVKLVAVTKEASIEQVRDAVAAGCTDLGENRAQQLAERAELVPEANWHFIGPLQTNKIRYLDGACLIHSLESKHQAAALAKRNRAFEVLLEVNVADEPSKHGVRPVEIDRILEEFGAYPNVTVRGFMFMAPQAENPEDVRWVFAEGAKLKERYGLEELSMGMTDDFEVAIEEGATIVRIGRAIFAS